jgi:hypothetical protein
VNGSDSSLGAIDGLHTTDIATSELESLVEEARAWSAEISPPVVPGPPAPAPLAALPTVSPTAADPAADPAGRGWDRGWDPLSAISGNGHAPAPAPPEVAAAGPTEPTESAETYSAVVPGTLARPALSEAAGLTGPNVAAPHPGTPDLGILSPLAGTVPAGGLLAWAQAASRSAEQDLPNPVDRPAPTGVAPPLPLTPPTSPAPVARSSPLAPSPLAPSPLAPSPLASSPLVPAPPAPLTPAPTKPAPSPASAWNALPAPVPVNGAGPATQARSTADGLRKLTRRVPGASLPEQDNSLRRDTPTTTNRNPLGLTGALAQYLSATANDGRAEKEQNPR